MGSKRRLLPQLLSRVPDTFARYHEPFLGSGAMLYALRPPVALCADVVPGLIELHKAVSQRVQNVCDDYRQVARRPGRRATFLDIRERYPNIQPAEFLFMIKNCHGTRYRVNRKGKFNCPYKVSNQTDMSEQSIASDLARVQTAAAYSSANHTEFAVRDVELSLQLVTPGDFVFIDPPYQWQADKETDYGREFGAQGWTRLMAALASVPHGASIMVTLHGSMTEEHVRSLALPVPRLRHLQALSFMGSHMSRGGLATRSEWLLTNYAC